MISGNSSVLLHHACNPVKRPVCNRLALVLPLLLAGCSANPYTFIFNDNVVYTPGQLPVAGVLLDASLQGCVNQVLNVSEQQNQQRDLESITLLACPGAEIRTLAGIENLPNLEQLELSDNAITNLAPLASLKNLRVLSIRNNNIEDIRLFEDMPLLRFVSLQGNERIPCIQLDRLEDKLGNTLNRPATCVG